jgi:hypothetical protein
LDGDIILENVVEKANRIAAQKHERDSANEAKAEQAKRLEVERKRLILEKFKLAAVPIFNALNEMAAQKGASFSVLDRMSAGKGDSKDAYIIDAHLNPKAEDACSGCSIFFFVDGLVDIHTRRDRKMDTQTKPCDKVLYTASARENCLRSFSFGKVAPERIDVEKILDVAVKRLIDNYCYKHVM